MCVALVLTLGETPLGRCLKYCRENKGSKRTVGSGLSGELRVRPLLFSEMVDPNDWLIKRVFMTDGEKSQSTKVLSPKHQVQPWRALVAIAVIASHASQRDAHPRRFP